MAQIATTDGGNEEPELLNEVPTAGFTVRSNNEEVELYGDGLGGDLGCIEHEYDGWPAKGIVRYDVDGYEIVDYVLADVDADEQEAAFEAFEAEIEEYIELVLFSSERVDGRPSVDRVGAHTIQVTDPFEGDTYTVELETSNKRRVE